MASQIAHIVYAKKFFEKYDLFSKEKDEFILGATFPDIRRIDRSIKRKDTHLGFYPLDLNFKNLTSFESGWKFHLYCDMRREEILNTYDFYSLKFTNELWNHPAKMLEDILIYDQYSDWKRLANYFDNVPFISNDINVSQKTFELWYSILADYIEEKPDNDIEKNFFLKQPALAPIANNIIKIVDKLRKNDKVIEILKKVCEEII
jgi:hypothetical protein